MAEEENNSRVAELKARLEADPESRVFYQLGEELRKSKRTEEAETVLREGLEKHSAYLSAWISLGRVLKESGRSSEAIDVLNRAFELDRQNVVVARLLGDAYLETGENVEAIKKYKLVAALHPADEDVQQQIADLEKSLSAEGRFEPPAPEPAATPLSEPEHEMVEDLEGAAKSDLPEQAVEGEPGGEAPGALPGARWEDEGGIAAEGGTIDSGAEAGLPGTPEPPFDDTQKTAEELPADLESDELEGATESEEPEDSATSDVVETITMGDLYARQGHVERAREIYRKVLERDSNHQEARQRLESIEDQPEPRERPEMAEDQPESSEASAREGKIRRLEAWLSKVNR